MENCDADHRGVDNDRRAGAWDIAVSQDYAIRHCWDPFLREMQFRDGARAAARGVRVSGRAWTGLTMEVEFVNFRPPSSVAMKMVSGPWFFRQFAGAWLFRVLESEQTAVTFRYSFQTRWPWLRPSLDPILEWTFHRDIRARLSGLKRGVEQLGLIERLDQLKMLRADNETW